MIDYDRFCEVLVGLKQAGFLAYRTRDANLPFGIDVLFDGDQEFTSFADPQEAWDACRARCKGSDV